MHTTTCCLASTVTLLALASTADLALAQGQVTGWGGSEQLSTSGASPLLPRISIAAGAATTAAVRADGTLEFFGSTYPAQGGLQGLLQVALGDGCAIALKSDGTVVCWGTNVYGASTPPEGLRDVRQVAAGRLHKVVLRANGEVVCWGPGSNPSDYSNGPHWNQSIVPGDLGPASYVAAGLDHSLAVRVDGQVRCWGRNDFGQSTVPPDVGAATQVAGGWRHSAALRQNGTVRPWGSLVQAPASLRGVMQIASGMFHMVARKADGTVSCWGGTNASGELSPPSGLAGVVQVAAGHYHCVALKSDGSIVCWGSNSSAECEVPDGRGSFVQVSSFQHTIALRADGSLRCWGSNGWGEATVPSTVGAVSQVAAGWGHSVARRTNGTVACWGRNLEGQCSVPASLGTVTRVAAGSWYTLALRANGTVVGWGSNNYGERSVPTGLSGVSGIAAAKTAGGTDHSMAVRSNGTVVCWGFNGHGQCNVPGGLAGAVQVDAGSYHSVARRSDGTVVCWGAGTTTTGTPQDRGQSIVPTGLGGVISVAAGGLHTLALLADGSVVGWGDGEFGQNSAPSGLRGTTSIGAGLVHSLAVLSPEQSSCSNSDGGGAASIAINGSSWQDVATWSWSAGAGPQVPGALTDVVIGEFKSVGSLCDAQCATLDVASSASILVPIDLSQPGSAQDHSIDVSGVARLRGRLWVLASGGTQLPADLSVPIVNAGSFDGTFSILQTTVPAPAGKFATLVPSPALGGGATWSLALRDLPSGLEPGEGAAGVVAGTAVAAETMDLNGDGFDDLALAIDNGPALNGTVQVLLNDGFGNLGGTTSVFADAGAPTPTSIATGDADGDGRDDLVVGLAGNGTARLFLGGGSGSGTLTGSTAYSASQRPVSVMIMPSEQGGAGSVFVGTTGKSNRVGVYAANAGVPVQEVVVQPVPRVIGRRGTIVATGGSATSTVDGLVGENGALAVLSPDGSGAYSVTLTIPVPGRPAGIDVADIDRDGIADVLTSNTSPQQLGSGTAPGLLTLFKGTASGFGDAIPIAPAGATEGADASMVDVNQDGVRDIVSVHQTLVGQSSAVAIPVHQDAPGGPLTLGEPLTIAATRPVLCPRGDVLGPGREGVFIVDAGTSSLSDPSLLGGKGARAIPFRALPAPCQGDLDGDGEVGALDLAALLAGWGAAGTAADLDANGVVDALDLAILLAAWGSCVE